MLLPEMILLLFYYLRAERVEIFTTKNDIYKRNPKRQILFIRKILTRTFEIEIEGKTKSEF